ncbi:UDP-3-O-(3-hydroxymyristoyl)glucosamine N-acyltransferase [Henriciella sp. AS95]|uniref:UDP-3-O-(3-hydroxymyristoyl)glucosamine N-acyltransferase n=1 Tax=Henriciella sp. AS95 TaxID=3135782 RepID=UPI0031705383
MAVDSRFYDHIGPISLAEIASLTGAKFEGDGDVLIQDVAASHSAGPSEVSYYEGSKAPTPSDVSPNAQACFVVEKFADALPPGVAPLIVPLPRYAHYVAAHSLIRYRNWFDTGPDDGAASIHESARVHSTAVIGAGAAIGDRTVVGPHAVIGPGVQVGRDCQIGANASVQSALVGNSVKIYSGARIGESGFGVMPGPDGATDAPQFGRVILQDFVTVGANSCIDRGAFDDTILGEHTKIDNLCQIAHNVVVGRNVLMASFAGISGTVTIGDGVMLGGRVGIADHVVVGEGAQIAASAGVFREIPAGETWGGIPAKPLRQWMKEVAWLNRQIEVSKKK